MKYIFSYYVKEPQIYQRRVPWWLRWWRKTLPETKKQWIRKACCAVLPTGLTEEQLIEVLDSFAVVDKPIAQVQLEQVPSWTTEYVSTST